VHGGAGRGRRAVDHHHHLRGGGGGGVVALFDDQVDWDLAAQTADVALTEVVAQLVHLTRPHTVPPAHIATRCTRIAITAWLYSSLAIFFDICDAKVVGIGDIIAVDDRVECSILPAGTGHGFALSYAGCRTIGTSVDVDLCGA